MRRIAFALAVGIAMPAAIADSAVPDRAAGEPHPIIGTWKWTHPFNSCPEVLEFRIDGTLTVLSGKKKTDNIFTITREPDSAGFFELRQKTVKDYGGTDCANTDNDDTGKGYESYIVFEPSKDKYLSCSDPRMDVCIGPLRRVSAHGVVTLRSSLPAGEGYVGLRGRPGPDLRR